MRKQRIRTMQCNTHFFMAWYIIFFTSFDICVLFIRNHSFLLFPCHCSVQCFMGQKKCYNKRFSVRFGLLSFENLSVCLYFLCECFVFTSCALDKTVNRFLPHQFFFASSFHFSFLFSFSFHTHCQHCRRCRRFLFLRWMLIYFYFVVTLTLHIYHSRFWW